MFKGILFDLDGTLIDTLQLIEECYRFTFHKKMGLDVPVQKIMKHLGLPLKDICTIFAPDRVEEAISYYLEAYNRHHDRLIKVYPGVWEVLDHIKDNGLKLGVVTSKNRTNTGKALKLFGVEQFLDVIVSSDDCRLHKPHPEPVLKALTFLQIDPGQVLLIGDSPYDIRAGKAAGVKTGGITWGVSTSEELLAYQPDFLLGGLNEVLDIIGLTGKVRR